MAKRQLRSMTAHCHTLALRLNTECRITIWRASRDLHSHTSCTSLDIHRHRTYTRGPGGPRVANKGLPCHTPLLGVVLFAQQATWQTASTYTNCIPDGVLATWLSRCCKSLGYHRNYIIRTCKCASWLPLPSVSWISFWPISLRPKSWIKRLHTFLLCTRA